MSHVRHFSVFDYTHPPFYVKQILIIREVIFLTISAWHFQGGGRFIEVNNFSLKIQAYLRYLIHLV